MIDRRNLALIGIAVAGITAFTWAAVHHTGGVTVGIVQSEDREATASGTAIAREASRVPARDPVSPSEHVDSMHGSRGASNSGHVPPDQVARCSEEERVTTPSYPLGDNPDQLVSVNDLPGSLASATRRAVHTMAEALAEDGAVVSIPEDYRVSPRTAESIVQRVRSMEREVAKAMERYYDHLSGETGELLEVPRGSTPADYITKLRAGGHPSLEISPSDHLLVTGAESKFYVQLIREGRNPEVDYHGFTYRGTSRLRVDAYSRLIGMLVFPVR